MTGRLVLAAHPDDAVLSCWRAVAGTGRGEDPPVTVVTVFGGAPPTGAALGDWDRAAGAANPLEAWRTRAAEDDRVLSGLGAKVVHLPFIDAQYRRGSVPLDTVAAAITELVWDADEVWIPAGIGGHPDHLLVAEIGLLVTGGKQRYLYADLPYAAAVPGWSAVLAAARRGRLDDESLAAQLAASAFTPGFGVPILTVLSPAEQAGKRESVLAYESQLTPLIGAFGRWFDDPAAAFEVAWDPGPGPGPGRPVDALIAKPEGRQPPRSGGSVPGRPPFLTVLMRTMGTRPEQLATALQSLAGQSCSDFELILLCHTSEDSAATTTGGPEPSLPGALPERTRIVPVRGGRRGRPLNAGADLATGTYLAVLDDDDLAHQDWVATFRRMALRHPGAVLRTRVSGERYDPANGAWLREDAEWPECFDLVDHLQVNASPSCGLAFPRACFTDFALRWDESLPVVEDWDLLIRAAALCGVASSPAITAAYRRWNRGDDSLTVHSDAEWQAAMRTVVVNADRRPLLLPPGSVTRLRRDHDLRTELQQQTADAKNTRQRLIPSHREDLARQHADLEHHRELLAAKELAYQELLAESHLQLADLRERHLQEVTTAVTANTAMFHASTSWRLTAPVRAVGALRLRLAQHRTRGAAVDHAANRAAPLPPPDPEEHPRSGVTLKPPPEPTVRTWPAVQFDQLYAQHPDPWGYTTSWYERRKYAITLACLPRQRYRRTFEPGCSVGVLSELLAARTDLLISADFSAVALRHARKRLATHQHVDVRQLSVPAEWPSGTFDLIVISELATYLSDDDLNALVERTTGSLEPDGTLLLVHFRPDTGTPHTAADVHDRFRRHPHLTQQTNHEDEQFILDVLGRTAQP